MRRRQACNQFSVSPSGHGCEVRPASRPRTILNDLSSRTMRGPPRPGRFVPFNDRFQQGLEPLQMRFESRHIGREFALYTAMALRKPDQPVWMRWQYRSVRINVTSIEYWSDMPYFVLSKSVTQLVKRVKLHLGKLEYSCP